MSYNNMVSKCELLDILFSPFFFVYLLIFGFTLRQMFPTTPQKIPDFIQTNNVFLWSPVTITYRRGSEVEGGSLQM